MNDRYSRETEVQLEMIAVGTAEELQGAPEQIRRLVIETQRLEFMLKQLDLLDYNGWIRQFREKATPEVALQIAEWVSQQHALKDRLGKARMALHHWVENYDSDEAQELGRVAARYNAVKGAFDAGQRLRRNAVHAVENAVRRTVDDDEQHTLWGL